MSKLNIYKNTRQLLREKTIKICALSLSILFMSTISACRIQKNKSSDSKIIETVANLEKDELIELKNKLISNKCNIKKNLENNSYEIEFYDHYVFSKDDIDNDNESERVITKKITISEEDANYLGINNSFEKLEEYKEPDLDKLVEHIINNYNNIVSVTKMENNLNEYIIIEEQFSREPIYKKSTENEDEVLGYATQYSGSRIYSISIEDAESYDISNMLEDKICNYQKNK